MDRLRKAFARTHPFSVRSDLLVPLATGLAIGGSTAWLLYKDEAEHPVTTAFIPVLAGLIAGLLVLVLLRLAELTWQYALHSHIERRQGLEETIRRLEGEAARPPPASSLRRPKITYRFVDKDLHFALEGQWGKVIEVINQDSDEAWIVNCYVKIVRLSGGYGNWAIGNDMYLQWLNPNPDNPRFCTFQKNASAYVFRQIGKAGERPYIAALEPSLRRTWNGDLMCLEIGASNLSVERACFKTFVSGPTTAPQVSLSRMTREPYDHDEAYYDSLRQ